MKFLLGTVRPISLLAWIPVVIGALLANASGSGLLYGSLGSMLSVGFINAFNNLIDRFQDRHNPLKKTLAVEHPVQAYYTALFLLPAVAIMLRHVEYNTVLLACLFYIGYWYSYVFGRVPYLKRLTVALCVAGTSFLLARTYPPSLWMWALTIAGYIFLREGRKDKEDWMEDRQFRFTHTKKVDWWCCTAPLFAAFLYLGCTGLTSGRIDLGDVMIACGLITAVWSYLQIRTVYGEYTVRLTHRTPAGRLGIVAALVGLMPSFTTTPFLLIVWINSVSVLYRSFLPRRGGRTFSAVVHDAALWGSIPVLVICKTGQAPPLLGYLALSLFLFTVVRQGYRYRLFQTA